jgi:hypothetical protein
VRQHRSAVEELRLELAPRSGRGARPSATQLSMALVVVVVEPSALVGGRLKMIMTYGSHTPVAVEGRKGGT